MLTLKQLHIHLGKQTLLAPSSIHLSNGCIAILGANGAGKSTLLKAIGQHIPYQGKVIWQQQDLSTLSWSEKAKQMVFMPQHSQLNFAFSVQDIVLMGLMAHSPNKKTSFDLLEQVLDCFSINQLREKNYLHLSGGEKQRVQAARTWIQILATKKPKLVLLDEPTSALDLKHQHQFLQETQKLGQQHTVLIVLHDLNLAARYCDHILLLKAGEAFKFGTTSQMLTTNTIQHIYDYQAEIHQFSEQIWVR